MHTRLAGLIILACLCVGVTALLVKHKLANDIIPSTTTTTHPYVSLGLKTITAYSAYESCDYPLNDYCLMADGQPARIGTIACPYEFKLGTRFIIEGKEYICQDRTSLQFNGRFDIFMGYGYENYLKAKEWGIRELEVLLLTD